MNTTDQDALRKELARLVRGHNWNWRCGNYDEYEAGEKVASRIKTLVATLPDGVEIHDANAPAHRRLKADR